MAELCELAGCERPAEGGYSLLARMPDGSERVLIVCCECHRKVAVSSAGFSTRSASAPGGEE